MEIEQISLDFGPPRRVLTVSELNSAIRVLLDKEFQSIWVAGEVSGVKLAASGHYYFTLKDGQSQLRCVCFRNSARLLRFKPQDGMAVLARGRIDVYEPRGEYQLLVELIEPQGFGALQFAFEQLKQRLLAEGLFDATRKRPLPRLPLRAGIVTSPTGAVIRDMLHVLRRRFPGLHVRLYPAQVQGEGSVAEVVEGIDYFSQSGWPDVVIVGRGGGSLEDLWTFNEEAVARAIARSRVPVVSAVGHETDVTIADFTADLRAPTPSAAAELIVPTRQELLDQLETAELRLMRAVRFRLTDSERRLHQHGVDRASGFLQRSLGRSSQHIDDIDNRLRGRLRQLLETVQRRLISADTSLRGLDQRLLLAETRRRMEAAGNRAAEIMRLRLVRVSGHLESLAAQLAHLSPLGILDRGYAIVQDENGAVIKSAQSAPPGTNVCARLAKGRLRARVTESTQDGSSGLPS
jgi:exodeoxyribonuclease VII large subunit